jgi:hypothetical protein
MWTMGVRDGYFRCPFAVTYVSRSRRRIQQHRPCSFEIHSYQHYLVCVRLKGGGTSYKAAMEDKKKIWEDKHEAGASACLSLEMSAWASNRSHHPDTSFRPTESPQHLQAPNTQPHSPSPNSTRGRVQTKMPFYRMMCIAAHYPEYVCPPRASLSLTGWWLTHEPAAVLGELETHKGPRDAVCYARVG